MKCNIWNLNTECIPEEEEDKMIREAEMNYEEEQRRKKKPKTATTPMFININFIDDTGENLARTCRAQPCTAITKIIHSCAEIHHMQPEEIQLFYKGRDITQEETVGTAKIEDGYAIDLRIKAKKEVPAPGDHIIMTRDSEFDNLPRIHVHKGQEVATVKYAVFKTTAHVYIDDEFLCAIHKELRDVRLADSNGNHFVNFPFNFPEKDIDHLLSMLILLHTSWKHVSKNEEIATTIPGTTQCL